MKSTAILLLASACLSTLNLLAAPDPALLQRAREELFAGHAGEAQKLVEQYLAQNPPEPERDIATILHAQSLWTSRNRPKADELLASIKSDDPVVKAERLRFDAWDLQTRGKRLDALDAYEKLLATYPAQSSAMDLYYAADAAVQLRRKEEGAALVERHASRFPGSPFVPWARAVLLHFATDAPAGRRLMEQVIAQVHEPLLSLARQRQLIFIYGDYDDPQRVAHAKEVARALFLAGIVSPREITGQIAVVLRDRTHLDAPALWLLEVADEITEPTHAYQVRLEALKELILIGKLDSARTLVATWKTKATSDGERQVVQNAEALLEKSAWRIEGTLPAAWVRSKNSWRIVAVTDTLQTDNGPALVTSETKADAGGHFSLPLTGSKLSALVAYAESAGATPTLHALAYDFVVPRGKPLLRYPEDIAPTPAPAAAPIPAGPAITTSNGVTVVRLVERFGADWPTQLIQIDLDPPPAGNPAQLRIVDDAGHNLPCQYLGQDGHQAHVGVWCGLKANERRELRVSFGNSASAYADFPARVTTTPEGERYQVVASGGAQFRILARSQRQISPADAAADAFVQSVKGPDGRWRGHMRWQGEAPPVAVEVAPGLTGPIRTSFVCRYAFANGAKRTVTLSFDAGVPVMLIDEQGEGDRPGDFVFDFDPSEGFTQFLSASEPYRNIEPLVKRQPRLGFYLRDYPYFSQNSSSAMISGAMAAANSASQDAVAAFVVHPGDWFDPSFTAAFTPLDAHPDAPWDHPGRYIGSTNSAIHGSVETDGHLPLMIPLTPGTRRWGLAVTGRQSIQSRDPDKLWEVQEILHAYNRGDLSRYLKMTFEWADAPVTQNPLPALIHRRLPALKAEQTLGNFAKARTSMGETWSANNGSRRMLLGIQDSDPARIIAGWQNVLHVMRWYGQLGVHNQTSVAGDLNPVGGREYHYSLLCYLIAEELGLVDDATRAEFKRLSALVAYRMDDADFMNYHMNAGQPNFEADRLLQLATFVSVFPNHPAAAAMRDRVIRATNEMLRQYTIREGGKWAENIGCYYLYSFSLVTRISELLSLDGRLGELTASPYFEPFCRFGINLASAPAPVDPAWLKQANPTPSKEAVRWIPGMGAHGGDGGRRIDSEFVLMSQTIAQANPNLSRDLLALWHAGGDCISSEEFGECAGEFTLFGKAEYPAAPALTFPQRRLPGWGMVMRDAVGTDREFFLAFRAGTAAYRDNGFGGGIVLSALGQPLSLEGGDTPLGEYHSTVLVQIGKNFSPAPRGPVTRWLVSDAVQFARGEFSQERSTDHFTRDVLFARNDYVVVHDTAESRWPALFNFVTPAKSVEPTDHGVLCRGKLGVDLWITALADQQPSATVAQLNYGNERARESQMWQQTAVRLPFQGRSTVLLYPVKAGAAAAAIKKLEANVWQISGPAFHDVLFTGDARVDLPGVGAVAFEGDLGLLRIVPGGWTCSLLNGRSMTVAGKILQTTAPTTVFFDGRDYRQVDGVAQEGR